MEQYKVVVCGVGNTGKSAFVQRFISGDFTERYNPTLGVEVHPLVFNTNKGFVQYNVWDCAGSDGLKGLADGYYINAHCAIVFVDSPEDNPSNGQGDGGNEWKQFIRDLRAIKHDLPIVLVRNKIDLHMGTSWNWSTVLQDEVSDGCDVIEISSKSNYNIEKPFHSLAKKLLGEDVVFMEAPPQPEPTVVDRDATAVFEQSLMESFQTIQQ